MSFVLDKKLFNIWLQLFNCSGANTLHENIYSFNLKHREYNIVILLPNKIQITSGKTNTIVNYRHINS